MKTARYFINIFAPSCILMLYVYFSHLAELYSKQSFSVLAPLVVQASGNIAVGLYLLLVIKRTFLLGGKPKGHTEYLLANLMVLVLFALTFIPSVNLGVLNYFLLSCIPQFSIILTVSIGSFCYTTKSNRKGKQQRDTDE